MVTTDLPTGETDRPASGDGHPPPRGPREADGNRGGPGDEKAWFMFYMQSGGRRQVVSLARVWFWMDLSRQRLWSTFEELEDLGYVERVQDDPRWRPRRLLDSCKSSNDRLFASTFVRLTEAGLASGELQALIASMTADYPESVAGVLRYLASSARLLPDRLKLGLAEEWERARRHENPSRRRFSGLLLVMYACTALLVVSLPVLAGMSVIAG
jgi:hypothetical protein